MIELYWPRMEATVTPSSACTAVSPWPKYLCRSCAATIADEFSIEPPFESEAPGPVP